MKKISIIIALMGLILTTACGGGGGGKDDDDRLSPTPNVPTNNEGDNNTGSTGIDDLHNEQTDQPAYSREYRL